MSKCENCLSQNVCKWWENGGGKYNLHCQDDVVCPYFKDKSLCVELPCKVGDEVWFNTFKKNATVCIGIQPHRVDRIDVVLVCGEKNLIETKIPNWQVGKTVFLTKEEAEKELEKRNAENK